MLYNNSNMYGLAIDKIGIKTTNSCEIFCIYSVTKIGKVEMEKCFLLQLFRKCSESNEILE